MTLPIPFTKKVIYQDAAEAKSHVYYIEKDETLDNIFWKFASMQADIWAFFLREEASSLKAVRSLDQNGSYKRVVDDNEAGTEQQQKLFVQKLTEYGVKKLRENEGCSVSKDALLPLLQEVGIIDPPGFYRFPSGARTHFNYHPLPEVISLLVEVLGDCDA